MQALPCMCQGIISFVFHFFVHKAKSNGSAYKTLISPKACLMPLEALCRPRHDIRVKFENYAPKPTKSQTQAKTQKTITIAETVVGALGDGHIHRLCVRQQRLAHLAHASDDRRNLGETVRASSSGGALHAEATSGGETRWGRPENEARTGSLCLCSGQRCRRGECAARVDPRGEQCGRME